MTHRCITVWLSHCKELSLCRQHLDEDRLCFGELQDPPVAEEVAAARSATQQPVCQTEKGFRRERKRLILTQATIDHRKSLDLGK